VVRRGVLRFINLTLKKVLIKLFFRYDSHLVLITPDGHLKEIYRVSKEEELIISDFGRWRNEGSEVIFPKESIWRRRGDLKGTLFR